MDFIFSVVLVLYCWWMSFQRVFSNERNDNRVENHQINICRTGLHIDRVCALLPAFLEGKICSEYGVWIRSM